MPKNKIDIQEEVKCYYNIQEELSEYSGLIFKNNVLFLNTKPLFLELLLL